jgi:hypothetical protein
MMKKEREPKKIIKKVELYLKKKNGTTDNQRRNSSK